MVQYLNIITAVSVIVTIISSSYFILKLRKEYMSEKLNVKISNVNIINIEDHYKKLKSLTYNNYKIVLLDINEPILDHEGKNSGLKSVKRSYVSVRNKSNYELKSDVNKFSNSMNEKDFEVIYAN